MISHSFVLLYSVFRPRAMSPTVRSSSYNASSEKKMDSEVSARVESHMHRSLTDQSSAPSDKINGSEILDIVKDGSSALLLDSDPDDSLLTNCNDKQKGEGIERMIGDSLSLSLDEFHPSHLGIKDHRSMDRSRGRGTWSEKTMPSKMENTGNKSYTDRNLKDLWRIAHLGYTKDKAYDSMRPHSAMETGLWVRFLVYLCRLHCTSHAKSFYLSIEVHLFFLPYLSRNLHILTLTVSLTGSSSLTHLLNLSLFLFLTPTPL